MSRGFSPEEACLKSLEQIADKSKLLPHLLNEKGLPRFGLNFYAVNKKGEYGGASMWSGRNFVVHDGKENKLRPIPYLYKKDS
jgi:N4-(beta-N-acetylglucosaminyl)-L-asparaginase